MTAPTPGAVFVVVRVADGAVVGSSPDSFGLALAHSGFCGHDTHALAAAHLKSGATYEHPEPANGLEVDGYRLARRAVAL